MTKTSFLHIIKRHVLVAQLDRASGFGPEGRGFEPCRVHHNYNSKFTSCIWSFFITLIDMNLLLTSHLVLTFSTFFLGLFVYSNYQKGYLYSKLGKFLALIHIGSALTGLFLNPTLKSPFVWLAILTLTTIPNGIRLLPKGKGEFKRSMFFSWLGLCVAMIGTIYPGRRLGFALWNSLNVSEELATTYTNYLIIGMGIIAIGLVILLLKKRILKD